ncbi:MAG: PA0069 family radical SAM protein [Burkholderiales bacterium]|nr:PA0069 family radical SAM protein [Burkholderiales bacterium]
MQAGRDPHPLPDDGPAEPVGLPRPDPPAIKGRGTPIRIAHRFSRDERAPDDDGWPADEDGADIAPPPATQVTEEHARSLLSFNDSPDIPFDRSINPYRGCEHGCIYCYARPTHSYLDLSPGLDFETQLVAKVNAVEVLRRELARPGYRAAPVNIGSITDAYQPVERHLRLTRGLLELLTACEHPFTLISKSSGVERDLDLLAPAAARRQAAVFISLTSLDNRLSRILEPRAAAPARRLLTVQRLAQAGVPVAVNVAPVIPFLNEPEIERLVQAAVDAGARSIHWTVLRLPWEVAPLFRQWLDQHYPDRADRVMARIHDLRGGRDNDPRFGSRMKGQGIWAELIAQRMRGAIARAGLQPAPLALDASRFSPPPTGGRAVSPSRPPLRHPAAGDAQGSLF